MQSGKIVFVARACNIKCILHQSCPMKTEHFTPVINPLSLSFMTVQLFHPMNNRFTAVLRQLYHCVRR